MKKAKLVMALLTLVILVGSVLAFKAKRYNSTVVYTTASGTITTLAVVVTKNSVVYSTVVPYCTATNAFFSNVGLKVNAFSWSVSTTWAFAADGSSTTVPYEICPPTFSFTTSLAD